MRRLLVAVLMIMAMALVAETSAAAAGPGAGVAASALRHCGSFKYGLDGLPPGPSEITGRGVRCQLARSVALHGGKPGWQCHLVKGLLFACRHHRAVVRFYGE